MALVERDDALDTLRGLLADCAGGRGQVALVSGGLASGKSELLQVFSDHVADSGALLLTATGSRAESTLRMGVMGQLFHGAVLPAEISDRAARLLSVDGAAAGEADSDPVAIRQSDVAAVHELCSLFLELSEQRPVVIGIDDVQFADGWSLQVLLYLQRRIRAARVLVILSEWEQPRPTRPVFRAEVTRQRHHRIRLAPLTRDGVAGLVSQHVDSATANQLTPLYHALSGGNPMLVHALIEDYHSSPRDGGGRPEAQPVVGVAFGQAVLACLHRWEPRLLEVARGVAVLGEQATPTLVARLVGVTSDSAAQVFDILIGAGLLDAGRFRHPVARTAVLDTLPPEARSRMHARAAELLYQNGAAAVEVAWHLIAADRAVGRWAVEVLRDAAEQSLVDDDVARAVQCLDLAMRACQDENARAAITTALARVKWRVNPSAAALHLQPLHTALREGDLAGRDAVVLARNLLWQGDTDPVAAALAVLNRSVGPSDAQVAAELRLACHWIYGSARHFRTPDDARQGRDTDHPAQAQGNPWIRAATTLASVSNQGTGEELAAGAERLLQSCRLGDTTLEVIASALLTLTNAGKPGKAAAWCDSLTEEAVRRRATTWQAVLCGVRATIALRQGDLATAGTRAKSALALLPAEGWGVLIGLPLSALLLATTGMGRYEDAAEVLKQFVPEAMFQTVFGLRYLHARGQFYLATDRALAALGDFQTCDRLVREWNLDPAEVAVVRNDLAQAHLRLEHRKVARDLVSKLLERGRGLDNRTRGTALRILAASIELRQRPQQLRKAVDVLQGCGDRLELARALADLSQAHRELGEFTRARTMARRAAAEAKACHADALARRLSRSGAEDTTEQADRPDKRIEAEGLPALSDAERRVATLAALGHTNREIGRTLYITVSTVEQHLTRVYRKLNVNSRSDLPVGLSLDDVAAVAGG